ncbi:MAG: hypothetical protein ACPGQD_04365 [Planctomycetota bacterium]
MAYGSIAGVRAAGISASVADDPTVTALLAEATAFIDRVTGSWFESRSVTLTLDGEGTRHLHFDVPPISITEVRRHDRIDATSEEVAAGDYLTYTDPENPKLHHLTACWERGHQNYEVDGSFGWLVDGATPGGITRAANLLAARWARPVSEQDATEYRRGDIKRVRVQGREVEWGNATAATGSWTGDPDIDRILALYRRPIAARAV